MKNSPIMKQQLRNKLDDQNLKKNYFNQEFSNQTKKIDLELSELDENLLSLNSSNYTNNKISPNSRISQEIKSNLMNGVKNLDLSYENVQKDINTKFRLNNKHKLNQLTDRLLSENEKVKDYYEKNYKKISSNPADQFNTKKFMLSQIDAKNEKINKSFDQDLTDKIKKDKEKRKKQRLNAQKIFKKSDQQKSNSIENASIELYADNFKNSNDEEINKTPKFSKFKANDSKKLNDLFFKPKNQFQNTSLINVYYKELKNNVQSDSQRQKPLRSLPDESKHQNNNFNQNIKNNQLLNSNENETEIKFNQLQLNSKDEKLKNEDEILINRRTKAEKSRNEEYFKKEKLNSNFRKIEYNQVGNNQYDINLNSKEMIKTEQQDSIYQADNMAQMKDQRQNPLEVLDDDEENSLKKIK